MSKSQGVWVYDRRSASFDYLTSRWSSLKRQRLKRCWTNQSLCKNETCCFVPREASWASRQLGTTHHPPSFSALQRGALPHQRPWLSLVYWLCQRMLASSPPRRHRCPSGRCFTLEPIIANRPFRAELSAQCSYDEYRTKVHSLAQRARDRESTKESKITMGRSPGIRTTHLH